MRTLILLRGVPGAGKSTWIKENNLEEYTLCPDTIRLMYSSPNVAIGDNKYQISQQNDKMVWRTLFNILEHRMRNGELTVIDATHISTKSINAYKELREKYRYRVYVIDFTSKILDTLISQNNARAEYKRVPQDVIERMYNRLDNEKVPAWATVVPNTANIEEVIGYTPMDANEYKKIHFIGDIHGAYDTLKLAIKENIVDDELYVFVGDYLDRGKQNKEVLEYIASISNKKNVILLEGNHEKWLRMYVNNNIADIKSPTFLEETMPQINKQDAEIVCRKLSQIAYIEFNNVKFFATHGGIPFMPKNGMEIQKIKTQDYYKGVGGYGFDVDAPFADIESDTYMVHGHRNSQNNPTISGNSINLQSKLGCEFEGGKLRTVTVEVVEGDVTFTPNEFVSIEGVQDNTLEFPTTKGEVSDIILSLSKNKNLNVKRYGNIFSINFTRKAFEKRRWDNTTIKSRGLFLNNEGEVVARSYDKFFNLNEHEETQTDVIVRDCAFPAQVFLKENGFLGILSAHNGQLLFASKSTIVGDHVDMFRDIFNKTICKFQADEILRYLEDTKTSMIFEVIDPINDPHIISYNDRHIVLLDIVKNQMDTVILPYNELVDVANMLDIQVKQLIETIDNQEQLEAFLNKAKDADHIEGYVAVDNNGFTFKIKTTFYNRWKKWRLVFSGNKSPLIHDEEDVAIDKFWKENGDAYVGMSVIDIRKMFEYSK